MADIYRQLQYLADIVAETAKRSPRRIPDGRIGNPALLERFRAAEKKKRPVGRFPIDSAWQGTGVPHREPSA
ncbi:hypothetical protein QF001_001136 [Paraburkholderia youngii]|uniref:hypothetical protein n=1 Tax=Paraburkholderia youngii TaxID=2782701 RepID=UPI003D1F4060